MAGARTRSISVGPTGVAILGELGTWLQVIDGGLYGYRNKLSLSNRNVDDAVQGESDVPCIAGNLIVADFDQVTIRTPTGLADTVIVRVGSGRPPEQPTGKPRVRWLAQSQQVIGASTNVAILDYTGDARVDGEQIERYECLDWAGWVVADGAIAVVATLAGQAAGSDVIAASYDVRRTTALANLPTAITTWACSFFDQSQLNDTQRAPFPPNLRRLHVVNLTAAPINAYWLVGVRG